ncbi:MAG TPA: TlpA disulfide reductase family protein [Acidobacteriota bacterium]|nr:TlpA disulfide reductase family protein [Acidobacteriota bacterium]
MRRMTVAALALLMITLPLLAQGQAEMGVLQEVRKMMAESGGRVTFSELANSDRFSAEQKTFLLRLYEIFFQIPAVLKSEYENTGKIPTRQNVADNFGISTQSVDLLLAVMKSDPRVPSMFTLDSSSREIASLNVDNIEAFMEQRGASVQVTAWEGKALPDFELPTLDGETVSAQDLRGHGSLIYFWFTGCPPCVRIAPRLAKLDEMYRDKGLRIVGINADRVLDIQVSDQQRRSYLEKHGIRFVNAHLNRSVRQAFGGIQIFPTIFFADQEGTIVAHYINEQQYDTLQATAEKVTGDR